jgi:hypothetical protein
MLGFLSYIASTLLRTHLYRQMAKRRSSTKQTDVVANGCAGSVAAVSRAVKELGRITMISAKIKFSA